MTTTTPLFHRPALATRLATQILATGVGSASSSGVFLAAPRRTGKSTFVREDLRPALTAVGAIVVYADLWANPSADPGQVIVSAIRASLAESDGVIMRLAKRVGMGKVNVGGALTFDLERVGLGTDVSLTEALVALSDEFQKMLVLVIDEAQHAITTDAGVAALFALKAARDELNSSNHFGLRVICTGSNRDKLAMLRNSKDQAFFGAPLVPFPTLDKSYVQWLCNAANLPFQLDPNEVWDLFVEAGYRPELLGAAADQFRFDFSVDPADGPSCFAQEVRRLANEINQDLLRVVHSLTPIQFAVLCVMAATGTEYAPFEAGTMELYRQAIVAAGMSTKEVKVAEPNVQQALLALQEKKLIWKASRGVYAIEESSVEELLKTNGYLNGLSTK